MNELFWKITRGLDFFFAQRELFTLASLPVLNRNDAILSAINWLIYSQMNTQFNFQMIENGRVGRLSHWQRRDVYLIKFDWLGDIGLK